MSKEKTVCERVEQTTDECIEWLTTTWNYCQGYVVDSYNSLPTYRIVKK